MLDVIGKRFLGYLVTLGGVWMAEDFARRLTLWKPSDDSQTIVDLSSILAAGEHPHSLTFDNLTLWVTTYGDASNPNAGRMLRVNSPTSVDASPAFSTLGLEGGCTGITRDASGSFWLALFRKRMLARVTKQ